MYQPFLISGFKTAKSIDMEPWLSPPDAFPTLENMIINKGVLEKRLGFSTFATMKHGSTAQTATSIVGIKTYLKNGMPHLLIMDSKGSAGAYTGRCNFYNPVDASMTDISSDLDSPAKIFTGSPSDFIHFCNWQGVGYMVNNVDQIHQWTGRGTAVVPFNIQINTTDSKTNHIDTCRYIFIKDDRMLLLDTVERGDWCPQRCRYSPVLQTDFSAPGAGYVDAPTQHRISAVGFVGKSIAVYMQGTPKGSLWLIKSTGNADIPFKWERVTETENIRAPYSGVEIKDGLAAIGVTNIVFYDGFKIKDLDIPNLRDVLDEFSDTYIRSVFGYNQGEKRHLLFTFAASGSSSIDRILDYNAMENNWTIHKSVQSFFVNCIGGFNGQKVPSMAELDDVVASDGAAVSAMTVDSRAVLGTPSPYTLIGCRNSQVYKWADGEYDGTNDANGKIAINATSIRFNPFVKQGLKVACEKIGFLVDNDSGASFLASVYKDTRSTDTVIGSDTNEYRCILGHISAAASRPVTGADYATYWEATGGSGAAETWVTATTYSTAYKTKTISCDGSNDKFWAWIFCDGEIGNFHRLKISHTEKGNTPKIHAFMPYFDSAGRLDL